MDLHERLHGHLFILSTFTRWHHQSSQGHRAFAASDCGLVLNIFLYFEWHCGMVVV